MCIKNICSQHSQRKDEIKFRRMQVGIIRVQLRAPQYHTVVHVFVYILIIISENYINLSNKYLVFIVQIYG